MKLKIYHIIMRLMDAHSAVLQSFGVSKWDIRDYSIVHAILVKLASWLTSQ